MKAGRVEIVANALGDVRVVFDDESRTRHEELGMKSVLGHQGMNQFDNEEGNSGEYRGCWNRENPRPDNSAGDAPLHGR